MSETTADTHQLDLELVTLMEWLVCWRETMARRYGDPLPADIDLYNLLGVRPAAGAPVPTEAVA